MPNTSNPIDMLNSGLPRTAANSLVLLLIVLTLPLAFADGLLYMWREWGAIEEYSHAYMIPLLAMFFVYNKLSIDGIGAQGNEWPGVLIVLIGMLLCLVGELSTLYIVTQLAFILCLFGLAYVLLGKTGFKAVAVPMLMLVFMIPLPDFIYILLSAKLQLISSSLGVVLIKLAGVDVFHEGNVIDLGAVKLQVVEACSGLRYLFPLMTLGFIAAYVYKAPWWQKLLLFLTTIPITVIMNSLRIGLIGVSVDRWGPQMAEGFLHDFEGWFIFMGCLAVLLLEMQLLLRWTQAGKKLSDVFVIQLSRSPIDWQNILALKAPAYWVLVISVMTLAIAYVVPKRDVIIPEREEFYTFPMQIAEWQGRSDYLEQRFIDGLKFDDYLLANYSSPENHHINLYSAYYAYQSKGRSAHSPRTCLPGGGWKINEFDQVDIPWQTRNFGADSNTLNSLRANRVLIQQEGKYQLVYYWFEQRGRNITNEYMVKAYLLWDAIVKNRTDGALVRVIMPVEQGQSVQSVDDEIRRFIQAMKPEFSRFVRE